MISPVDRFIYRALLAPFISVSGLQFFPPHDGQCKFCLNNGWEISSTAEGSRFYCSCQHQRSARGIPDYDWRGKTAQISHQPLSPDAPKASDGLLLLQFSKGMYTPNNTTATALCADLPVVSVAADCSGSVLTATNAGKAG